MTDTGRDPWLLTPGPLTTSRSVKEAMLHDWGSRDRNFIAINRQVRERLVALAGGEGTHVCVPLQGSGTFVVEATVGTLMPRDAKALILVNGAYGQRIAKICDYYQRRYIILETPENIPCSAADLDAALSADAALSHVFVIHCETTSGILNPVAEVAEVTARHGRKLIIDAMSAFGAVPLDAREVPFDAVVASSNKCIEGVPGVGFAIIRESLLKECKGNAPSLTLDLYDQWQTMEKTAQWRFTPPTHVIAAFEQALREHEEEGGVAGRGARYRRNCKILVDGMRELGFETLLPDALQAPIIVTFHMPADPSFVFQDFYDNLGERGFVIYPGKLTVADSFRIGCIGRLGDDEMRAALVAVRETLEQMGVTRCGPKESSPAVA
ncbi:MAG: 2-aminoethylphosphonate--pyruvate transaminase [Gammaproteobacteria bacterium]|nr:2-aminoethylphosphonate--pyruvate transaminase [Gammaproteobacteria bacterium]MDX2460213.1 2-aminoethylphosphonate--pyruvate transaminase [Gammaproteobacteria bacterium]